MPGAAARANLRPMSARPLWLALALSLAAACSDDGGGTVTPVDAPRPIDAIDAPLGPVPRIEPAACRFEVDPRLGLAEGTGYTCGDLIVAEDRAAPVRHLRLHYVRFASAAGTDDAVLYLDGGPGGDGQNIVDYVAYLGPSFLQGLTVRGDFLVLGQRGTSRSVPFLECPGGDCGFGLDVDLRAYNTGTNADDVEDLRTALGLDQLDLYGISYGSRLALEVMRRHGAHVRSAVIEGLVPPQLVWTAEIPASFHGALTALAASCTAHGACGAAYGDLVGKFLAGVGALNDAPVSIRTDGGPVELDGYTYAGLFFRMMYSRSSYPWLPLVIHDLAQRRTDRVNDFVAAWAERGGASTISRGLYYSVVCSELYDPPTPGAFEAANADVPAPFVELFGGSYFGLLEACRDWPTGGVQPQLAQPVTSSIRTLVSSGALDPITPPRFGRVAASTLANAVTVVHADSGHGATLQSPCGTDNLLDFLADPTAAHDTSCAATITTAYVLPSTAALATVRLDRARLRLDARLAPHLP